MKFIGGIWDGKEYPIKEDKERWDVPVMDSLTPIWGCEGAPNDIPTFRTETYVQFRIRGKDKVYPMMVLETLHPDHVLRMLIDGYNPSKPIETRLHVQKVREEMAESIKQQHREPGKMWRVELRETKENVDISIDKSKQISLERCKRWAKRNQTVDKNKYFEIQIPL